jgi:hypothetical protein
MRRLTNAQYNSAAKAVFADDSQPANNFPAAARLRSYDNQAEAQLVQRPHVDRWEKAAQALAAKAVANADSVLGCAGAALDGCAQAQLPSLAAKLFRRPLTAEEGQEYIGLYKQLSSTSAPERALELTVTAMLMSPNYLFVIEHGKPLGNGLFALTGHEIATRLSLMLWNETPGAEMMAAAAAGELDTPEKIATRARAMLSDPRAASVVQDFYSQWIGLQEADKLELPDGVPGTTKVAAKEEIQWFVKDWFEAGTGKLSDLFLSPKSFVNADLAAMYGVPAPAVPGPVELPAAERGGLLTRLMFVGLHANPPARGAFLLDKILCSPLPALAIMPPEAMVAEGSTTREFFEKNAQNPCAMGCHSVADPLGFAFENYDHFGVWRTAENGITVNVATEIKIGKPDVDGLVNGPKELSEKIANSRTAGDCMATHLFQYGNAREAEPEDQCSVRLMGDKLAASGGDVRELLVALTQTDAFRFVRKEGL